MSSRKIIAQKTPKYGLEPSAWELLEGAVHLLRRAPLSAWLIYLLGAIPWILAVLLFWARTTWFAPTLERIAWEALGLAGCFLWLKVAQAEFAARLNAMCHVTPPPSLNLSRVRRLLAEQTSLQVWGLITLPIALVLSVPFGWAYAYYQHASVIGETKDHTLAAASRRDAALWPAQNHLGLTGLSLLFLTAWLNLAFAFYGLPWLANRLLGIENLFGLSGWGWFNTTFLASVTLLSWLAVDPLVKAFYVLRHFHGQARESGADLRGVLATHRVTTLAAKTTRTASLVVVVLITFNAFCFSPTQLHAAPAAAPSLASPAAHAAPSLAITPANAPPPAVDAQQLGVAIEDVLKRSDYQWQLRPLPRDRVATPDENLGPIGRFFREGFSTLRDSLLWVKNTAKKFWDWLSGFFPDRNVTSSKTETGVAGSISALRLFLYGLLVVAGVLILWVIWLVLKQKRLPAPPSVEAQVFVAKAPDLRDENLHAAQMPEDGWLALAREQIAKGEWRLALRALYLARLARLGSQGLLSLAKHKTNLDYERELGRRAAGRAELLRDFSTARFTFETVWYGLGVAEESVVKNWMQTLAEARP